MSVLFKITLKDLFLSIGPPDITLKTCMAVVNVQEVGSEAPMISPAAVTMHCRVL